MHEPEPLSRAALGLRIAGGIVAIAVAAATIGAASFLPLPHVQAEPSEADVRPVGSAQSRTCPGGLLRLGDESGHDANALDTVGAAQLTSTGPLEAVAIDSTAGGETPSLVTQPGVGAAEVSAAQSQHADSDAVRGFAASDCAAPASDVWIVGGASTVGRTGVLIVTNPTEVAATVDISLFGASGPIAAPGATGIVISPRAQRLVPLAAFAPDEESPVVRVQSRGGGITATLQQTTERGIVADGADWVASALPGERLTIPGVTVRASALVRQHLATAGFADLATVLRLMTVGDEPVTATVGIAPVSTGGVGRSLESELEPGVVTEVPLTELEDGDYVVRIESDAPLVAGVRVSTVSAAATGSPGSSGSADAGASRAGDFMWLAAAPRLVEPTQFSVPAGPAPRLHLSNSSTSPATVTLERVGADTQTVEIAAGGAAVMPLAPVSAYRISIDGASDAAGDDPKSPQLHAAVVFAGDRALAAYPVAAAAAAEPRVRVVLQ
ncbi:DUF5719 family protein [Ruicaihuangia caeni]|uniref:DUF5719 family protein n=1 Tax=Ruicaihuangia caeni TaxID=3042517 RepID=UPI003390655E